MTLSGRRLTAALVVVAGVVSVTAVAIALRAQPTFDVILDDRSATVAWVQPGGPAWQSGIRSGQHVVTLGYGPGMQDWHLATLGGDAGYGASSAGELESLRATLALGATACLMTLLGFVAFARRRPLAGALALSAIGFTQLTFRSAGPSDGTTVLIAGTPLIASAWLATSAHPRRTHAALGVSAAVAAAWLVGRLWLPEVFPVADALMLIWVASLLVVALWVAVPWRDWIAAAVFLDPSRTVDLGALAVIAASALVALLTFSAPVWLVLLGVAIPLVVYPRMRGRLGALLEDLVLGSMRQHATITATEEERARLAHEIHDGPLQELAAVIGRLDDAPDMSREAHVLREVASELRGVTTALRPPVLDDLGLGAAVAFLVDQARLHVGEPPRIKCDIADLAGVGRGERAPQDVELAAFRVVQQALTNALNHAVATVILITGEISGAAIWLEVADDGIGIEDDAMRSARRAGHLGIASMRQRADAVGAELGIGSQSPRGGKVSFKWRQE